METEDDRNQAHRAGPGPGERGRAASMASRRKEGLRTLASVLVSIEVDGRHDIRRGLRRSTHHVLGSCGTELGHVGRRGPLRRGPAERDMLGHCSGLAAAWGSH